MLLDRKEYQRCRMVLEEAKDVFRKALDCATEVESDCVEKEEK